MDQQQLSKYNDYDSQNYSEKDSKLSFYQYLLDQDLKQFFQAKVKVRIICINPFKMDADPDELELDNFLYGQSALENRNDNKTTNEYLLKINQVNNIYSKNPKFKIAKYQQRLVTLYIKWIQRFLQTAINGSQFNEAIKILKQDIQKQQLAKAIMSSSYRERYCRKIQICFAEQLRMMHQQIKNQARTLRFELLDSYSWFNQANLMFFISQIYSSKQQLIRSLKQMHQSYESILCDKEDHIINQKKRYSELIQDNYDEMALLLANHISIFSNYAQKQNIITNVLRKQRIQLDYTNNYQFFKRQCLMQFLQGIFINKNQHVFQMMRKLMTNSKYINSSSRMVSNIGLMVDRRLRYLTKLQSTLNQIILLSQKQDKILSLAFKYQKSIESLFDQYSLECKNKNLIDQLGQKLKAKFEIALMEIQQSQKSVAL